EKSMGLRDSIPVGATLSMLAGSAAQTLLAWEEPDRLHRGLHGAKFTATILSGVRRRGWAQSVSERETGVAAVSAPVRGPSGPVARQCGDGRGQPAHRRAAGGRGELTRRLIGCAAASRPAGRHWPLRRRRRLR